MKAIIIVAKNLLFKKNTLKYWFSSFEHSVKFGYYSNFPDQTLAIIPVKLFCETTKRCKLLNWPRLFGMFPRRLFFINKRYKSEERFPTESGMSPTRLLPLSSSNRSSDNEPISFGIRPPRRLLTRRRLWRPEQPDMFAGISPLKLLLLKSSV